MPIKILSNSTINKIAAGEVIERPASVVKELVENAIDAGANKISILIEGAGKNLIIIHDNGTGMLKEELELAILRHATSKLDEDDLLNINSFGFRGEALPSIGAISKFKISSKHQTATTAYSLTISGGKISDTIISNLTEGTTVEVRDLFYATPARLKFLRSDKTELASIILVVKKIALANHNVSIKLSHEGKTIIDVSSVTDENSLQNRVAEIMGKEFIENVADIDFASNNIRIKGFTSLPTFNRASADEQYLFVNNRPVKDKILNVALKVAYQDYLARDRHPLSVIFIEIEPHFVDVNVHPAKNEVRFHDPNLVRSVTINAIREALNKTSNQVSNVASSRAINYMSQGSSDNRQLFNEKASIPRFSLPQTTTAKGKGYIRSDYIVASNQGLSATTPIAKNEVEQYQENEIHTQDKQFPLGVAKAQFHGTYIISQTDDSIIITDQHAAAERIGYEEIKKQIEKNGLIKQRLLMPTIVELPDSHRADLINDNKLALEKLGLSVDKFGDKSIIVSEVPHLIGGADVVKLIHDISDHLLAMGENIALTELIEEITETYACHYAIRAGRKLNYEEMNVLLRQMENTPFSGQCNHGRQTYVELKLKDIEKLFGRK